MLCLVAQSCLTLRNPMGCSLPGPSVHGDSPGKNTGVLWEQYWKIVVPSSRGMGTLRLVQTSCLTRKYKVHATSRERERKEERWSQGCRRVEGAGERPKERDAKNLGKS